MVSDRQASVHQSLQRRRCDVGCRCASRSSSCRAYSPRLKSAAPKCCDSPSRVSTPRPSFPLLFAQSNFSVSCELPPGQERAVADCVLVDPVLLHLVPNRHLQQPSGGRRSSVSRGGRPTALGAAQTGAATALAATAIAAESRPSPGHMMFWRCLFLSNSHAKRRGRTCRLSRISDGARTPASSPRPRRSSFPRCAGGTPL